MANIILRARFPSELYVIEFAPSSLSDFILFCCGDGIITSANARRSDWPDHDEAAFSTGYALGLDGKNHSAIHQARFATIRATPTTTNSHDGSGRFTLPQNKQTK